MAKIGFLINPLILDNHDALAARYRGWYQQDASGSSPAIRKVVKFRITFTKGLEVLSAKQATISFEKIIGLTFGSDEDQHKFYRSEAQLYDFNAELLDYNAPFPVCARIAFDETFYQFHAQSQLKFYKPPGILKLKTFYALHPDAYEHCAGVDIIVRLVTTKGADIPIFRRALTPVEEISDRGEQLLDVDLPDDEGTLIIEINPIKGTDWCQFLIRNLSMRP